MSIADGQCEFNDVKCEDGANENSGQRHATHRECGVDRSGAFTDSDTDVWYHPVLVLHVRLQAIVLLLQLALYRTHHALTTTHVGATGDVADQRNVNVAAAHPSISEDKAIIVRMLRCLHLLCDARAPTNISCTALGCDHAPPVSAYWHWHWYWSPHTPSTPENAPTWLRSSAGAGATATCRSVSGFDLQAPMTHPEIRTSPSASGFIRDGCGGRRVHLADSCARVATASEAVYDSHAVATSCHDALQVLTADVARLSPVVRTLLAAEQSMLELRLSALERDAEDMRGEDHWPANCAAPGPLSRRMLRRSMTPEHDGVLAAHRWVFYVEWENPTQPPSLYSGSVPKLGAVMVAVKTSPEARSSEPIKYIAPRDSNMILPPELDRPRGALLLLSSPLGQSSAHCELLRTELLLAKRRDTILAAIEDRCPQVVPCEGEPLNENSVFTAPAHAAASMPSSLQLCQQLKLSDHWHMRERLLRRCAVHFVLLERVAQAAVRSADCNMRSRTGATEVANVKAEALAKDGVVRPPLSTISAMIRSAVAVVQLHEVETARAQDRARDSEFYIHAAEFVASGAAAKLRLEMANAQRSRTHVLAAALTSNIMNATHCSAGPAAGVRTEPFVQTSVALLLTAEGETASHIVSRERWPMQIYAQVEWLHWRMQRVPPLVHPSHHAVVVPRPKTAETRKEDAVHAIAQGEGDDVNHVDRESDGAVDEGEAGSGEDSHAWLDALVMRGFDREIAALLKDAYEGRLASQGPEINLMKQTLLKGLVAASYSAAQAGKQQQPTVASTVLDNSPSAAVHALQPLPGPDAQVHLNVCPGDKKSVETGMADGTNAPDAGGLVTGVAGAWFDSLAISLAAFRGAFDAFSKGSALHQRLVRAPATTSTVTGIGGSVEAPGSRFLRLYEYDETHQQLQRWVNLDALLTAVNAEDTCRALAALCAAPLSSALKEERARLPCLVGLAIWRAAAIGSNLLSAGQVKAKVALRSAVLQLAAGYEKVEVCHRLAGAQSKHETLDGRTADLVHQGREDGLSLLVLRRLALRGLLRECEFRLADSLREQNYHMKHEAMRAVVQSGMLPTGLKISMLRAARKEEEVDVLHAEVLMVQRLLLRARITTELRHLRRMRAHDREMWQVVACAELDVPLLDAMASSVHRQSVLEGIFSDTKKALTWRTTELAAMLQRSSQLRRAAQRLEQYCEVRKGSSDEMRVSNEQHCVSTTSLYLVRLRTARHVCVQVSDGVPPVVVDAEAVSAVGSALPAASKLLMSGTRTKLVARTLARPGGGLPSSIVPLSPSAGSPPSRTIRFKGTPARRVVAAAQSRTHGSLLPSGIVAREVGKEEKFKRDKTLQQLDRDVAALEVATSSRCACNDERIRNSYVWPG